MPQLRVHAVVRLLAVDLRGEAGGARVVARDQRLDANPVGLLVEPAARDCMRPLEESELDERCAAVLLRPAVERERVGIVAEELVRGARMADLVLRDRRECDVLLEHRSDARPLRLAPAEDELVVSQLEQQLVHAPPSAAP